MLWLPVVPNIQPIPSAVCVVNFFAKRGKKHCWNNCIRAGEAYLAYLGMPVSDQDKRWAPHVICDYCLQTLEDWFRGEKRAMHFAIPRIWRDLSNYHTDCYFCMVDPTKQRKGKNAPPIEYPDNPWLSHLFFIIPLTCLCHSHPQEINLVQQRQVLKIPKRKVRHHQHLLCVIHVDWEIKDFPITLIKKTSMTSFERWH